MIASNSHQKTNPTGFVYNIWPTPILERLELYIQDAENAKNIVTFPPGNFCVRPPGAKGVMLRFPYYGLQVKSHIHPKFVICHIGRNVDLPRSMNHSFTKFYLKGRYADTLRALFSCHEIYSNWMRFGNERREQEQRRQEQRRREQEQKASTSTRRHSYNTRSQSSGTTRADW